MKIAVILAAISMSAALVGTWFLGDLLGIASLSFGEMIVFSLLFLLLLIVGTLLTGVSGLLAGCSEKVFGELMGLRSLLPLM